MNLILILKYFHHFTFFPFTMVVLLILLEYLEVMFKSKAFELLKSEHYGSLVWKCALSYEPGI